MHADSTQANAMGLRQNDSFEHEWVKTGNDSKRSYLKSLFNLGLEASTNNWSTILDELNLKEGQAMLMSCENHTISIQRKNGQYKVYDPNNSRIYETFATTEAMLKWAKKKAFGFKTNSLSININLIGLEKNETQPSLDELKEKIMGEYFNQNNLKSCLHFSVRMNDEKASQYLFNNNTLSPEQLRYIIAQAIGYDSESALSKILEQHPLNEDDKQTLLLLSAFNGKQHCFNVLNEKVKDVDTKTLLENAFSGGNNEIIKKALDKDFQRVKNPNQDYIKIPMSKEDTKKYIRNCIDNNNCYAINLLFSKTSRSNNQTLSTQENLNLLIFAIQSNHPLIVRALIDELPIKEDELNLLHIGLPAIKKYNTETFTILQNKGYQFSTYEQNLLDKKQHQKIGVLKALGIALTSFSQFITLRHGVSIRNFSIFNDHEIKENLSNSQNDLLVRELKHRANT